ncbi:terminase large subunit [Granulicella sp. 5B5]|uniref:terminase large subunit n=1 Tax=Granulicella sp. 5B5 TaxID=1617967 RepID=UPI0015F409C5|nr:terminase TerL endonuclease subunit [Granulicella sp. 5B5]QMV19683.1 terminase large subunit [Granulicella sp. 5B5]
MVYARGVVTGEIIACGFVKQACQRHLDDLEKSLDPLYPYRFDEGKANRPCWIISKFPHVSGKWARRVKGFDNRLVLEPWQCFIVCCLFGWISKSTGNRRFTKSYIEVNRKNAKSTLAATIGLYMLACDGEVDAQVFSGATKEKQALEVFRPGRLMAMRSHKFLLNFNVEVNKKSLTRADGSRFEPLVKNPGDGSSPSCAIVDEYHEHDTSTLYDAMESGMGAREQPLLFVITTAGFNVGGPCYMLRDDIIKVLAGTVKDDRQFGIIYTVDHVDEWKTDIGIAKANPNVGVSVSWEYLRGRQQDALEFAHKRNAILTKHFGVWTNAAADWMDMEKWKACADPSLSIKDFAGKPCWMGNDLAARIDLASRMLIFKESRTDRIFIEATDKDELVDQDHYTLFGYHYAPKSTIYDNEHRHYEQWVADGALIACDGVEVRLSQIQRDIENDAALYDMQCIAFDPWGAQQMQQDLASTFGEDVVCSIPQTPQYFSDPLKELRAAIYAGRVHHNGDPVLTWAVSNALINESPINETVMLRRGPNDKLKIDPVAAMITGMNRAYNAPTIQYTSTRVVAL